MTNLKKKLEALYSQKEKIEEEIKSLEQQIEEEILKSKQTKITFTKDEKIDIFKSLFIESSDIYTKN